MLKDCIDKLIRKENLTSDECVEALKEIISSDNQCCTAAFLVLLKSKGETPDEIYGIAKAMRASMIRVKTSRAVMDIVGTGGDGMNTFNISTASALLAASCGVKIAKHGNRAVSSLCGSADILTALNININQNAQEASESIEKDGFAFLFAPNYHSAMSKIAPVRKALGIPTCFNILGPLLNPACAEYMMLGVYKRELLDIMSDVLIKLGVKKALVYYGAGTDELTTAAVAEAYEITDGKKLSTCINSHDFGFKKCSIENLKGGGPNENAAILQSVFKGESGVISDTIILNAAFALNIYGIAPSVQDGIKIAKKALIDGSAEQFIKRLSTSYQHS